MTKMHLDFWLLMLFGVGIGIPDLYDKFADNIDLRVLFICIFST